MVFPGSANLRIRQRTQAINALRGHLGAFGQSCRRVPRTQRDCSPSSKDPESGPARRCHCHVDGAGRSAHPSGDGDLQSRCRDRQSREGDRGCATVDDCTRDRPPDCHGHRGPGPAARDVPQGARLRAWLGLTPRQHSPGGKQRLGATTKMGERSLRRRLGIIAANSVIIKRHIPAAALPGKWLARMPTRKPQMLVRAVTCPPDVPCSSRVSFGVDVGSVSGWASARRASDGGARCLARNAA